MPHFTFLLLICCYSQSDVPFRSSVSNFCLCCYATQRPAAQHMGTRCASEKRLMELPGTPPCFPSRGTSGDLASASAPDLLVAIGETTALGCREREFKVGGNNWAASLSLSACHDGPTKHCRGLVRENNVIICFLSLGSS